MGDVCAVRAGAWGAWEGSAGRGSAGEKEGSALLLVVHALCDSVCTVWVLGAATSEKVVKSARLEEIRLTILNMMMQYHPESSEQVLLAGVVWECWRGAGTAWRGRWPVQHAERSAQGCGAGQGFC